MATARPDPTVIRRRLRNELRKAREATGLTQREVAEAMDWSLSKLIRIESGQVSISTNDLKALLAHYGITDKALVNEMIKNARASRERSWWNRYRNLVAPQFLDFLGYESSASHIRNFEPIYIPGLLQTEEYAREVMRSVARRSTEVVDSLVGLRLERRDRLLRHEGPRMYFLLDEAVIRHVVGSSAIMRQQLNYLGALDSNDRVEILVLPFNAGLHPLSSTAMVHFEFSGSYDEDILYIENPMGDFFIARESGAEDASEVNPSMYLDYFWTIENVARTSNSQSLIERALRELSNE